MRTKIRLTKRHIIILGLLLAGIAIVLFCVRCVFNKSEGFTLNDSPTPNSMFSKSNPPKTICFVWGGKKSGNEHGLGDKIRCLVHIFLYCRKRGVNLVWDAHQHELGKYLKHSTSTMAKEIEGKPQIFINHDLTLEACDKLLDDELAKQDTIYIYNAVGSSSKFDADTLEYIKWVLEPSEDLKKEIDAKINVLPAHYTCQHVRFKDSVFENGSQEAKNSFEEFYQLVKNHSDEGKDVLLTNSTDFKKYVKETKKMDIKTVVCDGEECTATHLGGNGLYKADDNAYRNSLIDFYVMCGASKIKTYTQYDWVSNFAHWAAEMKQIPLEAPQGTKLWK